MPKEYTATDIFAELEHQLCELIKSKSKLEHKKISFEISKKRGHNTADKNSCPFAQKDDAQ